MLDGDKRLQPTAIAGQVVQDPYDPFRNPGRARAEELGDVLAEGIYWLLDHNKSIIDADKDHWATFLERRHEFISHVLRMVEESPIEPDDKRRRIAALKGSLGRLALITPGHCEEYLQAWASDQQRWHRHLAILPTRQTRASALASLSRKGSPRLTWQLGGQRVDRELREFTPTRMSAGPKDAVRLPRWAPQSAPPVQFAGISEASATAELEQRCRRA